MKPSEDRQTPQTGPVKKAYRSPRLEIYGKLRDLAQTVGVHGAADGGGGGNPNHVATKP